MFEESTEGLDVIKRLGVVTWRHSEGLKHEQPRATWKQNSNGEEEDGMILMDLHRKKGA